MSQAIFIVLIMFVDTQTIQSFFLISGLLKVSDLFFIFFILLKTWEKTLVVLERHAFFFEFS